MMTKRWLLPDGVEEVLAPSSWRLEAMREQFLSLFRTWGYDLVLPPLIEYLESLLTGAGHDLDLQTFKLTDQLSGRLMGIRADMTPQAARIDASRMPRNMPARLCYVGHVLRARPVGLGGSRSPLQVGAELFGHHGPESDREVLSLMLASLELAGIRNVHLDLGHVGIYRELAREAGLSGSAEEALFDILQRKSRPDLETFLACEAPAPDVADMLRELIELNGEAEVVDRAREALHGASAKVAAALDELSAAVTWLRKHQPDLQLHVDLAELRGYSYHTGLVYAAFVPGQGRELARGGRYDNVGAAFGGPRPATGFTADLALLTTSWPASGDSDTAGEPVHAPADEDPALERKIGALRAQGRRVIRAMPGMDASPGELGCTHVLVRAGSEWSVKAVAANPSGSR